MPDWLQRLVDNPVAFIGVLRALALAVLAFFPTLFLPDQMDAVFNALALLLPFVSLIFTRASATAHSAEVEAAKAEVPEGYVPSTPAVPEPEWDDYTPGELGEPQ